LFGIDMLFGRRSTVWLGNIAPLSESNDPNPPKVSVLIPARNEERNIREALQSVLHQDHPNLEFIVVNDRSTDRTGAILAEIAASDPRLRVSNLPSFPTAGWARNMRCIALLNRPAVNCCSSRTRTS
jgi:cellulose synthase/poly-beta-1,6-N-acetylglucosamine synthase-like glycosyltransferase